MKDVKKKKKEIYIIIACLFLLIVSLGVLIISKKEKPRENGEKEKIQEPEKEKVDPFADYELSDNNFRKGTNQELQVLFDKEELNQSDVLRLSNSLVNGYLYLLENKKSGVIYIKDLNAKDIGYLIAEFMYTTQNKVCTDMSFLEELMVLLFDGVGADLETDTEHFNEYSNSYCLDRETNKYKYHLTYSDYNYTKDYITIRYKKVLDNNDVGMLNVYFKSRENGYYLEKIDL